MKTPGVFHILFPLALILALLAGCTAAPAQPQPVVTEPVVPVTEPPVAATEALATTSEITPAPAVAETAAVVVTEAPGPQRARLPLPGIEVAGIPSAQAVQEVAAAGAAWLRINALEWSKIEPQEGQREWTAAAPLEAALRAAAENNLPVILVVRSTPAWAQKVAGAYCGPIKPEKLGAYAVFMQDVVMRYSQPPYNVKYYELGNEPDIDPALIGGDSPFGCQGNGADPMYGGGEYAAQLQQAYPAIKAANPDAQVLIGGLLLDCDPVNPPAGKYCVPARYLEGILAGGGGDFFDGVSYHAYDYYAGPYQYSNGNWHSSWNTNGPVVVPKTLFLRSLLKAYGYPDKLLLNTEAGLLCGRSGSEPECLAPEYELSKAYYVAELNFLSRLEGLDASIWYSLYGWRGTAMLTQDGKPLPVLKAFQFSAQQLEGAEPVGKVTGLPQVRGVEVQKEGKRIWLIWSADGQTYDVVLPAKPAAIYDVFGAAQPVNQQITLSSAPQYIEWAP